MQRSLTILRMLLPLFVFLNSNPTFISDNADHLYGADQSIEVQLPK